MDEVRQHQGATELLQYLKLYSSISLEKLAGMLDMTEGALRMQLMCMKNKNHERHWIPGSGDNLAGQFASTSDIDFFIDVDEVTGKEFLMIADSQTERSHVQTLVRHITRFQDIVMDIKRMPPVITRAGV